MKPEFMIERNGKAFCLYAGLLDEAHQKGLQSIQTVILQIPDDSNGQTALVLATVTMRQQCQESGEWLLRTYTGLGDAAPNNVARAMLTCLIRMAETRSKSRALRDAVNVGVVAVEELDGNGTGDDRAEDAAARPAPRPQPAAPRPPAAGATAPAHRQAAGPAARGAGGSIDDPATPAQKRMLEALAEQSGEPITMDGLTRRQASQLIDDIKTRLNQGRSS